MYTTREALAYSGKLPVQQNSTGVTPQLLDLLAMQKVDADKKAAAQALAMSAGQSNMPTVAQGIEQQALNSARGEIAQKLGLAGLMQQQAPQGPTPQMPPSQGIAGAPSPLPDSYQEGGIVAFAEAGQVPKADPEAETFVDSLGIERNAKTGDPVRSLLQRLGDFRDREQAKAEMPARRVANAADERMLRTAAPENIEERPYIERNLANRQPGVASLAGNITQQNRTLTPRVMPAGLADAAKANLAAVSPQVTTPVLYNPNSFTGMAMQNQKDVAALKPEDAYAKGKSEYQTEIGEGLARDVENQKARIAGIQALYDRQARERPSNFMRGLQLMGKNTTGIGLGGAFEGVSEGIDKTNAGYTTQDIANQTAIDGLNAAMEKARQSNDIGRYGAAKTARDAILTRQAEAKKELGPLAGYEQQAQTAALRLSSEEKRAIDQNANALRIANIQAAPRPDVTERQMAEYNRLKAIDPVAAEEYLKTLERIKTGSRGETAQQTLELKRQALMAKDESYKMAAIAYYNAKDPAKKQKAKDTMDAIEKAYGIVGDSTAGAGTPPPDVAALLQKYGK
jgi:hypothetical protein